MAEDGCFPFDLPIVHRKKATADFAGGLISSDGGLVLRGRRKASLPDFSNVAGECHPT